MTDLIAKALGCDDGDFIADSLVSLEVEGELGVVTLNNDFGGLLHCLKDCRLASLFEYLSVDLPWCERDPY